MCSCGSGAVGRHACRPIHQGKLKMIPQHLKCRELPNEIRINRVPRIELKYLADILQLFKAVLGAALFFKNAPQPNKDPQLIKSSRGVIAFLRKLQPILIETARLTFGELTLLPIRSIAERYDTGFPELQKFAITEAGAAQEFGQTHSDRGPLLVLKGF